MKWTHTAPPPPRSPDRPAAADAGAEPGAGAAAHPRADAPASGSVDLPLPPQDVRARLLQAVDTRFLSRVTNLVGFSLPGKPYVGYIGRRRFRIETRNGFGSHGGALVCYGSLDASEAGTHIRWRFGLHPFLRLAAGIWFFAAIFAGIMNPLHVLFAHGVTWGYRVAHLLMGIIGPSLMVIAGVVFIRYCLYSERDKKRVLAEMLAGL